MLRNSFKFIAVCFALVLLFAALPASFADTTGPKSVTAYTYVGTPAAPKALYVEMAAAGNSDSDPYASFYVDSGFWHVESLAVDNFSLTQVNGTTILSITSEGFLNDDENQPVLVTYTWTNLRSVNNVKIKIISYITGKVVNSVDTTKAPYTSVTGLYKFR